MKILKGNLVSAPALGKLEIVELPEQRLPQTPSAGEIAQALDKEAALIEAKLLPDGSIQSVEKAVPQNADAEVIDYGDSLIMPSFVDMHLHAPQYPMLGMGMDLPLIDWLNTYTFKTEARFEDSDYARRIYKKLASDLITSGTTRVCMFSSLHTDATLILMEELEKAGVTGYVGKVNMDRNGSPELQETTEQSKRETLRWLDACGRFKTVKPILTPRFTPSCTDELMSWLGKLAAERGLYVQSHLSENKGEIAWVKELCPDCAQYWDSYDRAGLWKDHTVMAHCIHSDERERSAIREAGVVVAHCPDSNINLCSGIAPVREMLSEGIHVALGTDIAAGASLAGNRMVTMSIQASKIRSFTEPSHPAFLTVSEAYYLGTTSGHRYFGAGSGFAPGDRLHAVVVDDRDFTETPWALSLPERLERALYTMNAANVSAVWSEGRLVLDRRTAAPVRKTAARSRKLG